MAFWRRYIVMRDRRAAARGYVRLNMAGNTMEVFASCPLKQDKYVLLLFGKGFTQRLHMRMQGKVAMAEGRVLLPRNERILAAVMSGQRMVLMGESDGALSDWSDAEQEAFNRSRRIKTSADKPTSTLRSQSVPPVTGGSQQGRESYQVPARLDTHWDGVNTDNDVQAIEAKGHEAVLPKSVADRQSMLPGQTQRKQIKPVPLTISIDVEQADDMDKPRKWSWRRQENVDRKAGKRMDTKKQPQQPKENATGDEDRQDIHQQQPSVQNKPADEEAIMEHAPKEREQPEPRHMRGITGGAQPRDEEYAASDFASPKRQQSQPEKEAKAQLQNAESDIHFYGEQADTVQDLIENQTDSSAEISEQVMDEDYATQYDGRQPQTQISGVQTAAGSEYTEPNAAVYEMPDKQDENIEQWPKEAGQVYHSIRIGSPYQGILADPPVLQGKYAGKWEWDTVSVPGSGFTYLLGRVEDDGQTVAVAVAVAGEYAPSPPANLSGFSGYSGGYWVLAQDAATGEQLAIG